MSHFSQVQVAPADAILGTVVAFKACPHPDKMNLCIGLYRDESGKPFVLDIVHKEEERIAALRLDKDYLPIDGAPEYNNACSSLLFSDSLFAKFKDQIVACQCLSGTGGLRVIGEFLRKFYNKDAPVFMSTPTWGNHPRIFRDAGFSTLGRYRYLKDNKLDFDGMCQDLKAIPSKSIVLLHLCAHNPSGVDPTNEQWDALADIFAKLDVYVVFDCAYVGFATGDKVRDTYASRKFLESGIQFASVISFAKNLTMYAERVGSLQIVCASKEEKTAVLSQLKLVIRGMYSNPPVNGSRIATNILTNPDLCDEWIKQMQRMTARIVNIRKAVFQGLSDKNTPGDWSCITDQIGLFSLLPLSEAQVKLMIDEHHVYMTMDGRVNLAGLTTATVDRFVSAVDSVVRGAS